MTKNINFDINVNTTSMLMSGNTPQKVATDIFDMIKNYFEENNIDYNINTFVEVDEYAS